VPVVTEKPLSLSVEAGKNNALDGRFLCFNIFITHYANSKELKPCDIA